MQDINTDFMRNLLSQKPFGKLAKAYWSNLWYGLGSAMLVEGVENPTVVQEKAENFLGKFKGIEETAFASVVAKTIRSLEIGRKNFISEGTRLFEEAFYEEPGLLQKEINVTRNLTVEEVKEYFEGLTNKCTRGSLGIHVYANHPAEETTAGDGTTGMDKEEACSVVKMVEIKKLKEWKDKQKLLPIYNLKE